LNADKNSLPTVKILRFKIFQKSDVMFRVQSLGSFFSGKPSARLTGERQLLPVCSTLSASKHRIY
jgi:hypothetical protein